MYLTHTPGAVFKLTRIKVKYSAKTHSFHRKMLKRQTIFLTWLLGLLFLLRRKIPPTGWLDKKMIIKRKIIPENDRTRNRTKYYFSHKRIKLTEIGNFADDGIRTNACNRAEWFPTQAIPYAVVNYSRLKEEKQKHRFKEKKFDACCGFAQRLSVVCILRFAPPLLLMNAFRPFARHEFSVFLSCPTRKSSHANDVCFWPLLTHEYPRCRNAAQTVTVIGVFN